MVSDIEFLEIVCERMQQVGLVQSKAEFSTRMLGKGLSYLTSMSARDRQVPDDVMAFLRNQLTADIKADDITIFLLSEERSQRQRDQLHRNDLLGWIARHEALPMGDETKAIAEPEPSAMVTIRKVLVGWMTRLTVSNRLLSNGGRQG